MLAGEGRVGGGKWQGAQDTIRTPRLLQELGGMREEVALPWSEDPNERASYHISPPLQASLPHYPTALSCLCSWSENNVFSWQLWL